MRDREPPYIQPPGPDWQTTQSSPLTPTPPRVQPPLREVLKGLDARELEGETVFDQLFGPELKPPSNRGGPKNPPHKPHHKPTGKR